MTKQESGKRLGAPAMRRGNYAWGLALAAVIVGLFAIGAYRYYTFFHEIFRGPPPSDQTLIKAFMEHRSLFDRIETAARPMTLPPSDELRTRYRVCDYSLNQGEGFECDDPQDRTPENLALCRELAAAIGAQSVRFGQSRDNLEPHVTVEISVFVSGMIISWHEKGYAHVDDPKTLRDEDYHSRVVDSTDGYHLPWNSNRPPFKVYRNIEGHWYVAFSGGG
jgi:hypothetical protein